MRHGNAVDETDFQILAQVANQNRLPWFGVVLLGPDGKIFVYHLCQCAKVILRVLNRSRGQQELRNIAQDIPERGSHSPLTVAQIVGFIDATEVPRQSGKVFGLVAGEVVGTEHNLTADEWIRGILPPQVLAVHHGDGKPELLRQLINPLRNQAGGEDNQDFTLALLPMSVDDETRLNGFP